MAGRASGAGSALLVCVLIAAAPAAAATRRAFVTSTTCNGNLGPCSAAVGDTGLAAANNICQERAAAAALDTNGEIFRAWISDSTADAYCNVLGLAGERFGAPPCGVAVLPDAGPWIRRDGVPFAATVGDLVTPGPITALGIDEFGATVPTGFYMTGSTASGTLDATRFCNGWTDDTVGFSTTGGNTDVLSSEWSYGASTSCLGQKRLLCFEVGGGDPFTYPSVPGALAFVSSTTSDGDLGGLAGADAECRALAAAAFLPSPDSFVAFLSDDTTDAIKRLTIDGPWKRMDGIPVADTLADLTDGTLDNPIAYSELDGRFTTDAWTGTEESGLSTGTNCLDWHSPDIGESGDRGRPWRSENAWTGTGITSISCDTPLHIFCLSNQVLLGWDSFESGDFHRWSSVVAGP